WRQTLDWSEIRVRLALRELEKEKLVQRLGEQGDETLLKILRRDFPTDALRRIREDLDAQKQERYRRLDEMTGYCKTVACRRRAMLDYFGDEETPDNDAFCCDNCDRAQRGDESHLPLESALPAPQESVSMPRDVAGDIHALLQGIDALQPRVGKSRLNKLLRGAQSKDIANFRAKGCELLGVLKGSGEKQVDEFLNTLIEHGLLHQADEDDYFVVSVTRAGREAWQSKSALTIDVPHAYSARSSMRSAGSSGSNYGSSSYGSSNGASAGAAWKGEWENVEDEELFQALRGWRRSKANEENLPPYCILADRALVEIALRKPAGEEDLRGVSGIGPVKIEKYGDAVLEIVREAGGE
ncbi:MAG: ATP-dependent helicase RecQ, partial [Abditibacteriota bacterium]|nr:ATP-dependent helicase RecQ [Abditibacteriota bacterium]